MYTQYIQQNLCHFKENLTDENFIEGFQHKEKRILGIMWHPEREVSYNWFDKIILKKIIK